MSSIPMIRPEELGEAAAVRRVNELAFGRHVEANLIEALRSHYTSLISLVAVIDGQVAGHILFCPVMVQSEESTWGAMALGTLAVLPERQRQGIGSHLVSAGLEACLAAGHEVVVVLGHPHYYPRFGFRIAAPLGIRWEMPAPDEAFMVRELREGALAGRRGVVRYLPEFAACEPSDRTTAPVLTAGPAPL
jgi:putative acetyltransferase